MAVRSVSCLHHEKWNIMRSFYLSSLLLLFLTQQAYTQVLRFEITGYDATQELYERRFRDAFLPVHFDGQGKRQGPALICSINDTKQEHPFFRGQWKDDLLTDTAYWYFPDGQLKRRAVFSPAKGTPANVLPWKEFETAGLRGILHGEVITWEKTYRNDSMYVSRVETFTMGKRSGTLYNYSRQGKLDYQEEYRDDLRNGNYIAYFASGIISREGSYENDKREGKWNYYYNNGALWQTSLYRKDQKEDSTITYHPNGKMRSVEMYTNGQEMGDHFDFDTLGRLHYYCHYTRYLQRDSVEIYYYPSGKIKERCQMRNDLRDGSYSAWHENGKLAETGRYTKSKKTGVWVFYNAKGVKTSQRDFDRNPEEDEIMGMSTMDAVAEEMAPEVITTVTELPDIRALSAGKTLSKEDQLKFLRKLDYVDITARIERDGKISYTIVTPLSDKNKQQLTSWLAANYGKARPYRFNGRPQLSTIHLRMHITK